MLRQTLNGTWSMGYKGKTLQGSIPGSVYSFLLDNKEIEDPYYRDNELSALALMDDDYEFSRSFSIGKDMMSCPSVRLLCEGLDTLATITVNGSAVGKAFNMHRRWEYEILPYIHEGENEISILFSSPVRYIREKDAEYHVGGSIHSMRGFPHLRKAHCMFGWDWGPRLPDAGIWKSISIVGADTSEITDFLITQRHENGKVWVKPLVSQSRSAELSIKLISPDGKAMKLENGKETEIPDPQLWWPNGIGAQPLYTAEAVLTENGKEADVQRKRIGLRTMELERKPDQWGESFAHSVNGVAFFAMGADYIPEDNILSRITPERTRKLLEQCKASNFNSVRVWGGGYYPNDDFYDSCDELGLVVWQDMMFACANYPLDYDFEDNITAEIEENVRRIRHHASLGLWCGNNEMEKFETVYEYDGSETTKAIYIRMYEHIIPHILRRLDPVTPYWPSSPSSGGSFEDPDNPDRGDVHYWAVWHGGVPFTEYRKYLFRYVSEFGFQSFPCLETIKSYTLPDDRNIFSRIMEMHQRNESANGRIMNYMGKTFRYPTSFEVLLYASQLLQAEAMKYGVEHWRRNRGRCMGAIYWQLNDIWPVASWASIDYFGRWKALQYFAKRFFSPVMISCEETGERSDRPFIQLEMKELPMTAKLNVANETPDAVEGTVEWSYRNSKSELISEGSFPVSVPAFTSVWMPPLDFGGTDYLDNHLCYSFVSGGKVISEGSVLFTEPRFYSFADPRLSVSVEGRKVTVKADAYARFVQVYDESEDVVFSDNYFDMEKGEKTIEIVSGNVTKLHVRSCYDIR